MATIDNLKAIGIDTDMGIKRCANREALYLKLIQTLPSNPGFNLLYEAIKNKDLDKAFEASHGLKGIIANLSVTNLESTIIDLTEHLRAKEDIDYSSYLDKIEEERKKLEEALK